MATAMAPNALGHLCLQLTIGGMVYRALDRPYRI